MATMTAPAATIVDNRTGDATSIDARAYGALRAFLRALGVAYTDEGGGTTSASPRSRPQRSWALLRGRSRD